MTDVFEVLKERGFIQQTTHDEPLRRLLQTEEVTLYCGFDPTRDSLHAGHLLPIMALAHFQRAGHRPIAILGGGTAMIGDPSGRTELREMMTKEQLVANAEGIRKQMARFLDFDNDRALMLNNGEWIWSLNYVDFLREVGSQFSVNRMLTAECFKTRLERGLSFIEFNYMLLQAYDFLTLYRRYGCRLQIGGDDQWSNIIAGAELIRRLEQGEAYGLTLPLLTTSSGRKMGKTEGGSVWLDPEKTSPYEFFQYWRNCEDADVEKLLALYTFLPMDEVRRLGALKDRALNEAKEILAYEVTKLVHGQDAADQALKAARALFGGTEGDDSAVPTSEVQRSVIEAGISLPELMELAGLVKSRSEARRLVKQGGIYLNDERVTDELLIVDGSDVVDGRIVIRKGKKGYHYILVQ